MLCSHMPLNDTSDDRCMKQETLLLSIVSDSITYFGLAVQGAEVVGRGDGKARQRNRISCVTDNRVQLAALDQNAQLPGISALPDAPRSKAQAPVKQQQGQERSADMETDQATAQHSRQNGTCDKDGAPSSNGTAANGNTAATANQKQKHAGKSGSSRDKAQLSNHDLVAAMLAIVNPLMREITTLSLKAQPNASADQSVQQRVAETLKEVKPHWKDLKRAAKGKSRRKATAAGEPPHKPQAAVLTAGSSQPADHTQPPAQKLNPSGANAAVTDIDTKDAPLPHARVSAAVPEPTAVAAAGKAGLGVTEKQHEASSVAAQAGAPGLDKLVDGVPAAAEQAAVRQGSRPAGPAAAPVPDQAADELAKPANGEPGVSAVASTPFNFYDTFYMDICVYVCLLRTVIYMYHVPWACMCQGLVDA